MRRRRRIVKVEDSFGQVRLRANGEVLAVVVCVAEEEGGRRKGEAFLNLSCRVSVNEG